MLLPKGMYKLKIVEIKIVPGKKESEIIRMNFKSDTGHEITEFFSIRNPLKLFWLAEKLNLRPKKWKATQDEKSLKRKFLNREATFLVEIQNFMNRQYNLTRF